MTTTLTAAAPAPAKLLPVAPKIVANRKHLDNRFPVLGFTIFTEKKAFVEVIATTRKELLDPKNAGQRTQQTFYSSRQDSGLIPNPSGTTIYLLPSAVLKGFAQTQPKPREIFYTLIAYIDATGANPSFAQPVETLPVSPPSVTISFDFSGQTAGGMFGREALRQRTLGIVPDGAVRGLETGAPDSAADRGEGEDGADAPAAIAHAASVSKNGKCPECSKQQRRVNPQPAPKQALSSNKSLSYKDGYEDEDDEHAATESLQTQYPVGAQEPGYLYGGSDDDDDDYGSYRGAGGYRSEHGDSNSRYTLLASKAPSAQAYGDEADEWEEAGHELPPNQSLAAVEAPPPKPAGPPLDISAKRDLIGKLGAYDAVVLDEDPDARGSGESSFHFGLSFGVLQFNQRNGQLGQLLALMAKRDRAKLREVMGSSVDDLKDMLTADDPAAGDRSVSRSARVQPVDGADLWEEPWVSRFRAAGRVVAFQAAQNELAATLYVDPLVPFAHWLGLNTERGLAILADRAARMGVEGAEQWVINAVSPVQAGAQRQQALAALGHPDLRSFQAATRGLPVDGVWGPLTQAAVIDALVKLGTKSPVPVPQPEQMLLAIVRRSANLPWGARVKELYDSERLKDEHFQS